jgi:hypothetical protein
MDTSNLALVIAASVAGPCIAMLCIIWNSRRKRLAMRPAGRSGPQPSAWEALGVDLRYREVIRRTYGWDGRVWQMPAAEETAAAVARFKEAAQKDEMLDLVWERYSHGRGLFVGEMRKSAQRRAKRRPRSEAPPKIRTWL